MVNWNATVKRWGWVVTSSILAACGAGPAQVSGTHAHDAAVDLASGSDLQKLTADAPDIAAAPVGPTLGGCPVFPPTDPWNTPVTTWPVDTVWTARLHAAAGARRLHPDYGNWGAEQYGIPVNVVPADQPAVPVAFDWWPDESDAGPYPFPGANVLQIEGGTPTACDGDCHVLVVQAGTCALFEGYACRWEAGWHCGNGARWDLTSTSLGQRPDGWTSADAAGLAILPGLVRYDEVAAGVIRHALRFTYHCTRAERRPPATHQAVPSGCDLQGDDSPPMGLRLRLRADADLAGLTARAKVVAVAMRTYGLILADNGSDYYVTGERHAGWSDAEDIAPLKTLPATAFEAIQAGP